MSKVINTLTHGAQLTSKVNAHSLTRGDLIALNGDAPVAELVEVRSVTEIKDHPGSLDITVRNETTGEWTGHWWMNEPVDRVTGARSAGQIN